MHAPDATPRGLARTVLWIPVVVVLGLGFLGLDRRSVWRDEAASLVAADRSLPELWAMLTHVESVHAVYYTFLHGWLQLGGGEVWARVPSVLAMAAAAGLLGVVGARLVSVPVGLVAGLLLAVNPSVSFYAQEARSTALVAAFALLATWLLLRAEERRSRWWVGYGLACAVLVGLNLLALLVPVAHAVTLLLWRRRRALVPWATAAAPAVLVAGVLGATAGLQPYQIAWIPEPGISSVRDFVLLALGPNLGVAGLVAALVLVSVLPTRCGPLRRLRALALPTAVLPSVVLVLVSFGHPIFVPRYVFPSVAAVSLLAALGVLRLGRVCRHPDGHPGRRRGRRRARRGRRRRRHPAAEPDRGLAHGRPRRRRPDRGHGRATGRRAALPAEQPPPRGARLPPVVRGAAGRRARRDPRAGRQPDGPAAPPARGPAEHRHQQPGLGPRPPGPRAAARGPGPPAPSSPSCSATSSRCRTPVPAAWASRSTSARRAS